MTLFWFEVVISTDQECNVCQSPQVSSHIKVEKSRKEANEKRLENALKENELLRDHLRRLQTRMHTFQDRMRVGNGTAVWAPTPGLVIEGDINLLLLHWLLKFVGRGHSHFRYIAQCLLYFVHTQLKSSDRYHFFELWKSIHLLCNLPIIDSNIIKGWVKKNLTKFAPLVFA